MTSFSEIKLGLRDVLYVIFISCTLSSGVTVIVKDIQHNADNTKKLNERLNTKAGRNAEAIEGLKLEHQSNDTE